MEGDKVEWRIYIGNENELSPVCVQWFDYKYDLKDFFVDHENKPIDCKTKENAERLVELLEDQDTLLRKQERAISIMRFARGLTDEETCW